MKQNRAINSKTRAILFDHDGTLIDSERVHFSLWQDVLKEYGVTMTEPFYSDVMAGIPVSQNAVDAVNAFNLPVSPEVLAATKHVRSKAYLNANPFPLMPHAVETLRKCYDSGYQLAIVTGGSRQSVERTLDARGIRHMISVTVAVEDVEYSKPAPDCYLKAMKMLGREPEQCVAVEDTSHGMQSALAAGAHCVVIPTHYSAQHDFTGATARYVSLQAWWMLES